MANVQELKPFRYFEVAESSKQLGGSHLVSLRLDHGVLVATVLINRLLDGRVLMDLAEEIESQVAHAAKGVVVDCSRVTSATSQFLGKLMALRKKAALVGVPLAVCGLQGCLREAFAVARFDRVLTVYPSLKDAVAEMGEFSAWERVSMDAVAQYNRASRREDRWRLVVPAKYISRRATLIAAAAIVAVLIAVPVVWWLWGGSVSAANSPVWAKAATTRLHGRVAYVSRGVTLNDEGSVVVAWPAGFVPASKRPLAATSLFAGPTEAQRLAPQGPFVVKTSSDGTYALDVPVPEIECSYYVLILSANSRNQAAVAPVDQSLLASYFRDPNALIGGHAYSLARCSLSPGRTSSIDWTAGRK